MLLASVAASSRQHLSCCLRAGSAFSSQAAAHGAHGRTQEPAASPHRAEGQEEQAQQASSSTAAHAAHTRYQQLLKVPLEDGGLLPKAQARKARRISPEARRVYQKFVGCLTKDGKKHAAEVGMRGRSHSGWAAPHSPFLQRIGILPMSRALTQLCTCMQATMRETLSLLQAELNRGALKI
jgi:hypothetical protein